jgi:hypothetical protein
LPLAACVSFAPLFDAFTPEAAAVPLRCCQVCPELKPCAAWLASLPLEDRPVGVVAGQVVVSHRSKFAPTD